MKTKSSTFALSLNLLMTISKVHAIKITHMLVLLYEWMNDREDLQSKCAIQWLNAWDTLFDEWNIKSESREL